MGTPRLQDLRLALLAAGFLGDAEAQDGVHLRWSFEPELGFPPEGFSLFIREAARKTSLKASFTALAVQLQQQPAPAAVAEGGVTVHRVDGDRLGVGVRCGRTGLELAAVPLVLHFRSHFAAPPGLVREVTLIGMTQSGGAFAQALHAGRIVDCAAMGQQACLRQIIDRPNAAQLSRLDDGEGLLSGRDLRRLRQRPRVSLADLVKAQRREATQALHALGVSDTTASASIPCVPFQLSLRADAIDEVRIAGCHGVLLGVVWSPFARDEGDAGWRLLQGPICLPVDPVVAHPCQHGMADARAVAKSRIPQPGELPAGAPTRAALEQRLLGADFDELHRSLEQALGAGGQLVQHITSDDPADGTRWRYDVVRDALTAAADPYFARVLGLYWVHAPDTTPRRFDYMVEATWPIDGEKQVFRFIVFDRGPEAQPALAAPTAPQATAMPGSAHVTPDGLLNPCEMDVVVNWRRPSACELADALRAPIAYLVERTAAGAPVGGPYALVTQRAFEAGGDPEVVPAIIADSEDGDPRFATGYYVDRGPGYGLFHYRVRGRDLFGRTSAPSSAAPVTVSDQVAPGPPLNLAAEYLDPADPDRSGSEVLAWANRDTPSGAPPRAATVVRWIWPASRQVQFPDLDEFRLYYRPGSLNHVLGRITAVTNAAAGEFDVMTDLAPIGPDIPAVPSAIDPGALRNEGEEFPVLTIRTVAGRLAFRVRANPAAPPLVGLCAWRLGRGTSATATQAARAPYAAFRSFEQPADWEGLLIEPTAPPRPLRIAADGKLRGSLPAGLAPADVQLTRTLESREEGVHWHYTLRLRGLALQPSIERPRAVGAFGIGSVDGVSNEGRIAPPASIMAVWRAAPSVPALVYPPANVATMADYHGTSYFLLEWTGIAGIAYQVYRAGDLDLLASAGIDLAAHRALGADAQRLQLQQLALDLAHIEAFRLVTASPLMSVGGPMQHRDALPGSVQNRFVYRVRAIDASGNLAPWPPSPSASCVVVDLPGVPPAPPTWADASFPASGGIVLRWVPNATVPLRGYRLYRADDAVQAQDLRSMTPLFATAQDEGGGALEAVVVTRDASGAIVDVSPPAPGPRPPGRLVQYHDATAPAGVTLYYRLVAEDAHGHRSAASERLAVQAPKRLPPQPPAWGPVALAAGSVELQWSASEPDLECLVLRRAEGGPRRALGVWGHPGAYTFIDTAVQAGTRYEYRVRVRDRVGHVVDGPLLNVDAL